MEAPLSEFCRGEPKSRWFQAPIRGLGHNWAVRQPVHTVQRARSSCTRDDRLLDPPATIGPSTYQC